MADFLKRWRVGLLLLTVASVTALGMLPELVWDLLPDRPWTAAESMVGLLVLVLVVCVAAVVVVPRLRGLGPFERIVKLNRAPRATLLVLPLSLMREEHAAVVDELQDFPDDGTLDDVVAVTNGTPWEVPAQVLLHVCADGHRPRNVLLVGSPPSPAGAPGSFDQGVALESAFKRCLGQQTHVSRMPVDINDIDRVREAVRSEVDSLTRTPAARGRKQVPHTVVFDATGGTKPISIALAMLTMDDSHTFVYWANQQLSAYDVRVHKPGDPLGL